MTRATAGKALVVALRHVAGYRLPGGKEKNNKNTFQ